MEFTKENIKTLIENHDELYGVVRTFLATASEIVSFNTDGYIKGIEFEEECLSIEMDDYSYGSQYDYYINIPWDVFDSPTEANVKAWRASVDEENRLAKERDSKRYYENKEKNERAQLKLLQEKYK